MRPYSREGTHRGTRPNRAGQQDWATLQDHARLWRARLTSDTNRSTATTAAVVLLLLASRLAGRSRLGHNRDHLVRVWSGGGVARGGRGSSGEGESGGEDERGVRARMRVRVRSRRRARHSAHRGRHDRRQLESEALSRHEALGHCDVHGALRRADLKLACGRTHTAHTTDALWAVPLRPPQPPSVLWPSMARVGTVLA